MYPGLGIIISYNPIYTSYVSVTVTIVMNANCYVIIVYITSCVVCVDED